MFKTATDCGAQRLLDIGVPPGGNSGWAPVFAMAGCDPSLQRGAALTHRHNKNQGFD